LVLTFQKLFRLVLVERCLLRYWCELKFELKYFVAWKEVRWPRLCLNEEVEILLILSLNWRWNFRILCLKKVDEVLRFWVKVKFFLLLFLTIFCFFKWIYEEGKRWKKLNKVRCWWFFFRLSSLNQCIKCFC
jgi:hypothetical protein